jgi:hypothetical protein
MQHVRNLINQKIGRLTVIARDYNTTPAERKISAKWICQCECGNIVSYLSRDLSNKNHVISCGCAHFKHGLYKTPEYNIWKGMKRRCYNKNYRQYKDYGGRGITICDRWLESFVNFYQDMGPRPNPNMNIERIDNNKGYEPSNCKWATTKEQNRNKNCNKIPDKQTADNIRQLYSTNNYTQQQLSVLFSCSENTIWDIINNKTWV